MVKAMPMPWVEAVLRGQRVLARANADGSLAAEGGRVEIRYKPNDGRAYRAAMGNLQLVPGAPLRGDDAVAPGEATARESREARPSSKNVPAAPAHAWVAYTDGACSGNPGPAGCGVVLVSPAGKMHEGFEYLGLATNNVAELTAILRAVEWGPTEGPAFVVHTDSQYAIGVLQKGWKAKANQELVARAKEAVRRRGVRLVYVPGHAGVPLNERADQLAREAVQTGRTRRAALPPSESSETNAPVE
jgi:ribonuclease HI